MVFCTTTTTVNKNNDCGVGLFFRKNFLTILLWWYTCVVKKTKKTQLNVLQIGSINHVGFVYYYNIICAYMKSSAPNIMTRRHRRHRFLMGRHRDLSQKCTPLTDRVYAVYVCYIVALCHRTIFIFQ